MATRSVWLWLYVGWHIAWLTEAIVNPKIDSICDLSPCRCSRGKLQCDCSSSVIQDVTLKTEWLDFYTFSSISVTNCTHVLIKSKAFTGLSALQQVSVANIAELTLEEQSFSWTAENNHQGGLLVNITNCIIEEIPSYCFRGNLRDIIMTSVKVSHVRSFAFSSIENADKIVFNNVEFKDFDPQAFKKFSVDILMISDSQFAWFPTRTMMDIDVRQEVRLQNIKVNKIQTGAINIHSSSSFRIVKSTVGHIERNAFNVITKGDVSIHDNIFNSLEKGSFLGFTVDRRYLQEAGKQDLMFENNTIGDFESTSLTFNTSGFDPRLDWIMINQTCSCPSVEYWSTDLVIFSSGTSYKNTAFQASSVMFCLNPNPIRVKDFQRLHCNVTKLSKIVKVLAIVGVVTALVAICIIIYCRVKKKGKRYINVPTAPSALKPANPQKPHMLVVPDGKTYRETELHVIVEHAQPIINTEFVKG